MQERTVAVIMFIAFLMMLVYSIAEEYQIKREYGMTYYEIAGLCQNKDFQDCETLEKIKKYCHPALIEIQSRCDVNGTFEGYG